MEVSKAKRKLSRLMRISTVSMVLICMIFAFFSTRQLSASIDEGNRNIILNYGNQVAARLHDLFSRVDASLAAMSRDVVAEDDGDERIWRHLTDYVDIWGVDATGFLMPDGTGWLPGGDQVSLTNEISLTDVLSFSQKLSISRQNINGADMLVFTKPCQRLVEGRPTVGIFAALRLERLEELLGDYGYGNDSFLVLTLSDGENIWNQRGGESLTGNCFTDLATMDIAKGDSAQQMRTRMNVAMNGTIAYTRPDGQDYYLAYVPLGVNYWYLLVSAPSDSVDLTELAQQHFTISTVLIAVILLMGAVSIIYLVQRNRSIIRYNEQLQVATAMAYEADKANQENKAKQEFMAKVSHEIRTPLNGVMGMITLAKAEYENEDKCMDYLDKATVSAKYLLGLLGDVLDMSQIESGKQRLLTENVDMEQLLEDVSALMETSARDKGLSFRMDSSALKHRYYQGDHLRIKQILTNLCANAVKYTHDGGWVELQALENDNGQVVFHVKDNGEGIEPDKLDKIFHPFEQVSAKRQGGVGLGLSIVRSFVELMGGTISVDSQVDKGSTFTVCLPLAVCDGPGETEREPVQGDLKGVRVLLAEDNALNAEIAVTLLSMWGAQVTLAQDGVQAVERLEQSAPGDFQVILMDIQMPRMDGLEATQRIRRSSHPQGADIPILAMTANAFHEQQEDMRAAGMNDFLYKPIDMVEVCRCIKKWLRGDEK